MYIFWHIGFTEFWNGWHDLQCHSRPLLHCCRLCVFSLDPSPSPSLSFAASPPFTISHPCSEAAPSEGAYSGGVGSSVISPAVFMAELRPKTRCVFSLSKKPMLSLGSSFEFCYEEVVDIRLRRRCAVYWHSIQRQSLTAWRTLANTLELLSTCCPTPRAM